MKLSALTCLLLMAAEWLRMAFMDLRIALKSEGDERAELLRIAREDAARYSSTCALWAHASITAI